ncbi:unnamed protein product [Trichobilharzia regenti]|nr:unnamed protein product [Trichobilharzia regenti]
MPSNLKIDTLPTFLLLVTRKLSILASAKAQNHTMPSDMINSNLVVLQHIGCGVIPDYILKMLTVLEKKLQNGLVSISELLGSEKIGGGKNLDNIKVRNINFFFN